MVPGALLEQGAVPLGPRGPRLEPLKLTRRDPGRLRLHAALGEQPHPRRVETLLPCDVIRDSVSARQTVGGGEDGDATTPIGRA